MKTVFKNALTRGVILPALITIVIANASTLAIVYPDTRHDYMNFMQTVVVCLFGMANKSGNGDK